MTFSRCAVLAGICLFLAQGCTTTEVKKYERVPESPVDYAYRQPGADFSKYTKLYAVPLEIYYAESAAPVDPADLERMRAIFRTSFLKVLGDDFEIARKPAADALGVRASLVDLRSSAAYGEIPVQGRLASLVENGQLTFLMELSDSVSGDVLARAADTEQMPVGQGRRPEADWEVATREAQRWAALFRDFLDRNLGETPAESG